MLRAKVYIVKTISMFGWISNIFHDCDKPVKRGIYMASKYESKQTLSLNKIITSKLQRLTNGPRISTVMAVFQRYMYTVIEFANWYTF